MTVSQTLKQFSPATVADERWITARRDGALVSFVLNRPKALNAFDDDMRGVIAAEIPKIARDPDIYIVAFSSASPKAFCAGGDVRALSLASRNDLAGVKARFGREYQMNWLLDCFSKPAVSLIDGICMGSGAGLSLFNTHRVAGEQYKLAMPETAIGLFPDVGVAHVFAQLPWPMGLYLGLTGRTIERADALWLGLATHCISARRFPEIESALADATPVDPLLDHLHETQEIGPLQKDWALIRDYFSPDTLMAIITKLERATGVGAEWAGQTLNNLRARSPMSLAVTDRHIRAARKLDLRQTLLQDFRLACRCLDASDFHEGVRAVLIDKDGKPEWNPATLEQVDEAVVESYFQSLGDMELTLATRDEMQAMRV